MKKWVKLERDNLDVKKGYNLCPICKQDTLEQQVDDENVYKERCGKGCYVYDFTKEKRIK